MGGLCVLLLMMFCVGMDLMCVFSIDVDSTIDPL